MFFDCHLSELELTIEISILVPCLLSTLLCGFEFGSKVELYIDLEVGISGCPVFPNTKTWSIVNMNMWRRRGPGNDRGPSSRNYSHFCSAFEWLPTLAFSGLRQALPGACPKASHRPLMLLTPLGHSLISAKSYASPQHTSVFL